MPHYETQKQDVLLIFLIFPDPVTRIICITERSNKVTVYTRGYSESVIDTAEEGKAAKTRDEEQCVPNAM